MAAQKGSSAEAPKKAKHNLEDQDWYHGYRPRKDIVRLLKSPGDFLVRATETGATTDIVLSLCSEDNKLVNLTIRYTEARGWHLASAKDIAKTTKKTESKKFSTICELIEHYRQNRLHKKLKLANVVARPKWLIKHNMVGFDKDKDLLGTGNFCNVYKGKYKMAEGEDRPVAVKISHLSQGTDETEEARESRKAMIHEAQLMSYYSHDNVIMLYGVACDHPPVLIVTEFCPGGDLLSHLIKFGAEIEIPERILYCLEAARGMNYLHKNNCVHRDLASRNCLISDKGCIKIADFGMSKMVEVDEARVEPAQQETIGKNDQVPLRWMAPESLKRPHTFSKKSDVWSFGVLCYEVFNNGEKPWPNMDVRKIATYIRNKRMPEMPSITPPTIVELVTKRMWQHEDDKRPSMRTIGASLREQHALMPIKAMERLTINRITGVKRVTDTVVDDSSEFDDSSSRCSTDGGNKKDAAAALRRKTRSTRTNTRKTAD